MTDDAPETPEEGAEETAPESPPSKDILWEGLGPK